jgi:hypothetical protein
MFTRLNRRLLVIGVGALMIPKEVIAQTPATNSSDPWIFGTGFDLLPTGTVGEVEVIASGTIVGNSIPIVVKNNSTNSVGILDVVASARDASGTLIGVAEVSSLAPYNIESGAIQVGLVYFGEAIPVDAIVEFKVEVDTPSDYFRNLLIVEAESTDSGLIGSVMNPYRSPTSGPISINGVGLDGTGTVVGYFSGYGATDDLDPEGTTLFNIDYYGGFAEHFLVGARGYE